MNRIVVHPFLFALYPILFLYSINISLSPFPEIIRITVLVLSIVLALTLILKLLTKSWQRAGLISSLAILLFSSFGYALRYLIDKKIGGIAIFQANVLAAGWAAILILGGWWFWRKAAHPFRFNLIFNLVSLFMLCLPIFQIGYYEVKQLFAQAKPDCLPSKTEYPIRNKSSRYPDIYYIILDGYARSDVMKEYLNYDDTGFIQYLKGKGFYVAEGSHSNYSTTQYSLTSSLNSTYLDNGYPQELWPCMVYGESYQQLIQNNSTRSFLEQAGYQFVTFSTLYSLTDIQDAKQYIHPTESLNEFEMMYLTNSASVLWYVSFQGSLYRTTTVNALDNLANLSNDESGPPRFIFDHILAAHPPFVFGPNGETITPQYFSVMYPPDKTRNEKYIKAYTNQVTYINKRLEGIIDQILANSNPKPIIIIQGDHGSKSRLDRFSADNTCLKERMSILNAYYFPDQDYRNLYPTITPVNSFRLVFDQYFGTHFGRLDDQEYFVEEWDQSPEFIPVTGRVNQCQNP